MTAAAAVADRDAHIQVPPPGYLPEWKTLPRQSCEKLSFSLTVPWSGVGLTMPSILSVPVSAQAHLQQHSPRLSDPYGVSRLSRPSVSSEVVLCHLQACIRCQTSARQLWQQQPASIWTNLSITCVAATAPCREAAAGATKWDPRCSACAAADEILLNTNPATWHSTHGSRSTVLPAAPARGVARHLARNC